MQLQHLEWHRVIAQLVLGLDRPNFWQSLTSALEDYAHFDSYLITRFPGNGAPAVIAANMISESDSELRLKNYVDSLFLLDPFYLYFKEHRRSGFFRLDEVAPDAFKSTDYYKRYFKLNVVADEVQFLYNQGHDGMISVALGSKRRFKPTEVAQLAVIAPWITALMHQRMHFELAPGARHDSQRSSAPLRLKFDEIMLQKMTAKLTAREMEISHLILAGFSAKSISSKLSISPETVKVHKKHLYAKLGVESQSELFSMFLQEKWTPKP
jgi:DNA-binding CsgD family transcriptional regulator